ncbi:MAG: hypothetical protein Ta2D_04070 [Rickettsiales bacterium]|nr:MAG: hypothetical protein Ta2D_04070 [Rickettsiales bacterium]
MFYNGRRSVNMKEIREKVKKMDKMELKKAIIKW